MMRLALAAMMLPAAAAAPTCTADSCCVDMVQGMCAGNTHDAAGKAVGDTGYTAAEVTAVDCTGGDGTTVGNTANKGAGTTGRTNVLCCEAPAAAAAAVATCADVNGDAAGTTAASNTDCGAGWKANGVGNCVGTACDFALEADKNMCCDVCPNGEFATATGDCTAHAVVACVAGKGFVGTTTADCATEGACCTACAAGTYTAGQALEPCAVCAAGSEVKDATPAVATTLGETCTGCATAFFDDDGDSSTACIADTVTACGAGEGYAAGTTTTDATCTACVIGETFTTGVAQEACATSSLPCGTAGQGNVASTSASVANTCANCPVNTYAATSDADCQTDCADGFFLDQTTTTATTCTTCTVGTHFDHDGIPSTACQAVSTSPVTACPAGEGFHAATNKADAVCVACVVGSTFTAGIAQEACVAITAATCAAGKGYASDATATTIDTAAACTACAAGKYGAGGDGVAAVCTDCAVGTFSAAGATTCTACASGLTTAAVAATVIADCVDNSAYCLLAMADDATDSDTDGQPFACPANKYVASDSQTAATTAVAQCSPAVPATGAAITAVTTCTEQLEVAAVTAVTAVTGDVPVVVLDGPDTVTTEVVGVTGVTAVAASCTVATGAGTCAMVTPVTEVSATDTTCPEPVAAAKVSGAAAAAPLAAVAALLAALA